MQHKQVFPFKERTPIKVYGYFSLDSMPDGVAYDFIVTRVEETDAEEMTILEYLITFPGINFSDAVVIVKIMERICFEWSISQALLIG